MQKDNPENIAQTLSKEIKKPIEYFDTEIPHIKHFALPIASLHMR